MADTTTPDDTTGATVPLPDPVQSQAIIGGMLPPEHQAGGTTNTPFTAVSPAAQPTPAGPFTQLAQPAQSIAVNRYGDTQTNITAALGALAQTQTGLVDPGTGADRLQSLIALNQDVIKNGQEKLLRNQIAAQARLNQVNQINATQNAMLQAPGDASFAGLKLQDLVNLGIDKQNQPDNPDSLEIEGVRHLQEMAAGDPDQSAIMQNLSQQGDVLDRIRDNVTKIQIFNREVDVLRQAKSDQSWVHDVADFAAGFIPFHDFFSRTNNVTDSNGRAPWGFWDLPSTIQNKEIATFWNKPLPEFQRDIASTFVKMTSQEFGAGQDVTKALETARQFGGNGLNQSDALSFNVWTGAEILGMIPLDRMAMVPSKMARMLGNRVASADMVASTLSSEIHGIPTAMEGLEQGYHAVEESLPSSLVPDTQSFIRPDVGVAGDVADRLAAIRKATEAVQGSIQTVDRLAPAQLEEAVTRAVKDAQLEFRDDPIADFKTGDIADREPFPQADLDNLHVVNKQGEVRALLAKLADRPFSRAELEGLPAEAMQTIRDAEDFVANGERGPKINAHTIADEHAADVSRAETAGFKDAADRLNAGPTLTAHGVSYTTTKGLTAKQLKDAQIFLDNNPGSNVLPTGVTKSLPKPPVEGGQVGGIRSIPTLSRQSDTGIYSLNFYLGKRYSSGGFLTKEGAEAAAVRRGFDLRDVAIHQNSDAQYFIKVRQAVTETGITNPVLRQADFPDAGWVPKASAFIKSADNILPEMFNRLRITQTVGKNKFLAGVIRPYIANIQKLNKASIRGLSKVLAVGERDQKWFTSAEFEVEFERASGHPPSAKEMLAYYSAKEISDINYHIFNNSVYAEKARRGLVTVAAKNDMFAFDTGRMNGRVIDKPDFNTLGRVFDLDEGVTKGVSDAADLTKKFETGNYRVLDLERPYARPGEDPVKKILAHNASSTIGPLERDQLGYVAGGSREYRYKWFVKQAQSGAFRDGTTYWQNPITHVTAKTGKIARDWAESMENARKAFFDSAMSDAEKRRIIELSPAETVEKFQQMVDNGMISKDHPFEALFDKEQPQAMSHLGEKDTNWIDRDETPAEGYAISKGRMYYSHKGEHLVDPHGDYAEIMDPLTTLHKATQNAAQTFSFGDYNKKVIDEWSRVASPYMDRSSVGNNLDSHNVFFNGKLSPDFYRKNPQFANQLENSRNVHKRMMGLQSPEQKMTYNAARRFADWVETKGKWGETLAGAALDRMSANPVNAVRGMVFDAKLGFFDPGQLIVQTQTALASMSVHPVYGLQTAAMLKPILHLMVNQSENLLDYYATRLLGVHGFKGADDFKDMIRSLRNSGWMNVSGEVAQLDQYMNTVGGSALARGFNKLREAGRIPFNWSEQFNRVTAYGIAWHATRDAFPELKATTREFQGLVNKKADDLSMNMTSSSAAFWQKGILSVPTQFLAYQSRVLENILPKAFGGTARFSGQQKLRLALGQVLLYGTTGLPLGNELMSWAAKSYEQANPGQQFSPELWRVMTKGFWDTALFYGTDGKIDTDFAHRAGQGAAWTDFFHKLTDGSMNNVLQVATGPVGAMADNMVNTVGKIATYMRAEQFGSLTTDDYVLFAGDLTQQISSLNRAEKAYWLWKTGTIVDPNSGEVVVNADRMNAIAAGLGIPLRQETERWDIIRDQKDRDTEVRDLGKMIAGVRRNAFRALEDGDEEKAAYYNKLASGLLTPYHDDPMLMQAIAAEGNKQLGYTEDDWNALVAKTYEKTGRMPNGGQ